METLSMGTDTPPYGDRHSPRQRIGFLPAPTGRPGGLETLSLWGQTLSLPPRWGCDGGGLQWVASNGGVRGQTLPLPPRGDRHYGGCAMGAAMGTDTPSPTLYFPGGQTLSTGTDTMGDWGQTLSPLRGGLLQWGQTLSPGAEVCESSLKPKQPLYSLHSSILRIGNSA